MLVNRIIGAFTFRSGVYKEVEMDTSFTPTAWMLVVVVAFLSTVGAVTGAAESFLGWIAGVILGTIGAVIAFAVATFVISWVGKGLFNADVTFEELVRTLGLAYVWRVVGVIGVLGVIPVLACLTAPVTVLAAILGLVAWLVAAKEALDLDWGRTLVTVIIGWLILVAVTFIFGLILGALGLGAAAAGGLFG
jgi:hypothetical protein